MQHASGRRIAIPRRDFASPISGWISRIVGQSRRDLASRAYLRLPTSVGYWVVMVDGPITVGKVAEVGCLRLVVRSSAQEAATKESQTRPDLRCVSRSWGGLVTQLEQLR